MNTTTSENVSKVRRKRSSIFDGRGNGLLLNSNHSTPTTTTTTITIKANNIKQQDVQRKRNSITIPSVNGISYTIKKNSIVFSNRKVSIPVLKNNNSRRKSSIITATATLGLDQVSLRGLSALKKEHLNRSEKDITEINTCIRAITYFDQLNEKIKLNLLQYMDYCDFKFKDHIQLIDEHSEEKWIYFILNGKCSVYFSSGENGIVDYGDDTFDHQEAITELVAGDTMKLLYDLDSTTTKYNSTSSTNPTLRKDGNIRVNIVCSEAGQGMRIKENDFKKFMTTRTTANNSDVEETRIQKVIWSHPSLISLCSQDPESRSMEVVRLIHSYIKEVSLMTQLPSLVQLKICRSLRFKPVAGNEFLFHQGDASDNYYIIISGEVKIYAKRSTAKLMGNTNSTSSIDDEFTKIYGDYVCTLKGGDTFGEKALVEEGTNKRTATCVCTKYTCFLTLSRDEFLNVIQSIGATKLLGSINWNMSRCKEVMRKTCSTGGNECSPRSSDDLDMLKQMTQTMDFFSSLKQKEIDQLCSTISLKNIKAGEPVFLQGDEAYYLYIILNGSVSVRVNHDVKKVSPRGDENYGIQVAQLYNGDSFGEKSFLNVESSKRSASIIATEDTDFIIISKEEFLKIESLNGGLTYCPERCIDILKKLSSERSKPEV